MAEKNQELRKVKWTQRMKESGTSQSKPRPKTGHMTKNCLTHSDEEAIIDFVKIHVELYDKAHEKFKDKARKECLRERFVSSRNLSVKVCKT